MLGHMEKVSHFWAQMKKNAKCQLGRFCPEPFNYSILYNNKINARVLIGQSAMVYCAGKPMEKSRVFWIII